MSRILAVVLLLLSAVAGASEPTQPGDACRKEGETVMVPCGSLTCVGEKYVVTMIGPACNVGAPCAVWDKTAPIKPDKWGMVCRDGRTAYAADAALKPGQYLGSEPVAQHVAAQYLGSLFTLADTPVIKGDRAYVHAKILGQVCDVILTRPSKNKSSWVVQGVTCDADVDFLSKK